MTLVTFEFLGEGMARSKLWSMKLGHIFGTTLIFFFFFSVAVWQSVVWSLTWPLIWLNCNFSLLSWSKFCANCPTKHIILQLRTHVSCDCVFIHTFNHCIDKRAIGAGRPLSVTLLWEIRQHPGKEPGKRQKKEFYRDRNLSFLRP